MSPTCYEKLLKYSPEYPIIKKEALHPDVVRAIKALVNLEECSSMVIQAYMQMILAHVFDEMKMMEVSIGEKKLLLNEELTNIIYVETKQ